MNAYFCKSCGREIFRSQDLLRMTNLWDLGEYQAEVFEVAGLSDPEGLRRYDVSLHEGWYCCRFIAMRMIVDKFGTGDALLVYADSVVEAPRDRPPIGRRLLKGQTRLGLRDFDAVIAAEANRDRLLVVKLSAEWCPPCRLMDSVIARLVAEGRLPRVSFFEIDVDEEEELAARFPNASIPYTVFYYNGKRLDLNPGPDLRGRLPLLDGGIVGGVPGALLERICREILARTHAFR